MIDKQYALQINKLLRRYLKHNNQPSFERLFSYAQLWRVADS
jgi:hypothetical protein